MRRVHYAPLLLLFALIPAAYGFTYQSQNFSYETPSGGTLRYGLDYTAQSWSVVGNRFTWGTVVYGGAAIGTTGFDPDLGAVMIITDMQAQSLNYTVAAVGVTMQRIYYRGLGAPTVVTGGTSTTAGGVTTVTTNGNQNVYLGWGALPGGGIRPGLEYTVDLFWSLLPLVAIIVSLEARRLDFIGNKIFLYVLVAALIGIMVYVIRAAGY